MVSIKIKLTGLLQKIIPKLVRLFLECHRHETVKDIHADTIINLKSYMIIILIVYNIYKTGKGIRILTLSLFTRRLDVFSPSTKLMASIRLDFPEKLKAEKLMKVALSN